KRGPLHTVRVLLSAESFSDLLSRYKYLHLIAAYDRRLVDHVRRLEANLVVQERELRQDQEQLERLRREKAQALAHLRELAARHEATLARYRARERQAEDRLAQRARDEARLTDAIATLQRRALDAERR